MADFLDLRLGAPLNLGGGGSTMTTLTLDQSTDAVEHIFQARDAVAITKGAFRYGVRTGTPPTLKLSLQGVDLTTGNPDGTIKGGGSPVSVTFTPPADATWNGTWRDLTFDNPYTPTKGEYLALVVGYDSGTIDGSNNSSVTTVCNIDGNKSLFPYAIANNGGVRTKSAGFPIFGYSSASKVYGHPMVAVDQTLYNSGSTPDERALRFMLPSTWGQTHAVVGVRFQVLMSTTDLRLNLYDGTTVIQDNDVDPQVVSSVASTIHWIDFYFNEATLAALNHGSVYRLGFQPQNAVNMGILAFQVASANDLQAYPGGTEWFMSTRTNAGAWTDDPLTRPVAELIIADWAVAAAGASGSHFIGG